MENIELRWIWHIGAKTLQYRTLTKKVWSDWQTVPLVDGI